jgi:hypothetical protein
MGTRGVVAIKDGDGWKGRYIHWDSYPSGVGLALVEILTRDGLEQAVKTLIETHYGWSQVTGESDLEPLSEGQDDGRFENIPGYGVAYTDTKITGYDGRPYQQVTEDQWILSGESDNGTEWAYVLFADHIDVYRRQTHDAKPMVGMFGLGDDEGYWKLVSAVALDVEGMGKVSNG